MNQIDALVRQTEDAYEWVNKFLTSVPFEKWDEVPQVIESNISWQAGHLVISLYYHSVMVVKGHQMDILQNIPVKDYSTWYNQTLPIESIGKAKPEVLFDHLLVMQRKSLQIIGSLSAEELQNDLEPVGPPHPVAKNIFDALDWNIKHTMYHCGQIGILLRLLEKRYDFGLKRAE